MKRVAGKLHKMAASSEESRFKRNLEVKLQRQKKSYTHLVYPPVSKGFFLRNSNNYIAAI